jgi:hypothetical protein
LEDYRYKLSLLKIQQFNKTISPQELFFQVKLLFINNSLLNFLAYSEHSYLKLQN